MEKPLVLNLGCGHNKAKDAINVDAFEICEPDLVWNLDDHPWPWDDNSVHHITAFHVLEHVDDWWGFIEECARVLVVSGVLEIRVPHESSSTAGTYRDHHHIFSVYSFFELEDRANPPLFTNLNVSDAFLKSRCNKVPLAITGYSVVPFKEYWWLAKWMPRVLMFLTGHFRNFVHEQRFDFIKTR